MLNLNGGKIGGPPAGGTTRRGAFDGRTAAALILVLGVILGVAGVLWSRHRASSVELEMESLVGLPAKETLPAYEPPSTHDYVGSVDCARCHAAIAELYQSHPMAHSITAVDAQLSGEMIHADSRIDGEQRIYDVEFADGAMRHHEKMFDAKGELIYDQAVPMQYIVGSGRGAQAFLHQRGDMLLMSPLNWYSDVGKWDMAPGYSPEDPRRFDRRITEGCLACHAGQVATTERGVHRFESEPFREMSVGCENCHGPGAQHIAWHEAKSSQRAGTDPIVNPSNLDHARRESVCNQCHLQAAERVTRFGRSDFDFRPGQLLEEIWTVLDTGTRVAEDGKSRAVSHVQQMRSSRCYVESGGELGCISCHDPHRAPAEVELAAFYRDRCLQCHTDSSCSSPMPQRQAEDDSCIACHMPRRDTTNVSHVTQTDHRVLRVKATESEPSDSTGSSQELVVMDDSHLRLSAWESDRALALGAWMHLSKAGRPAGRELLEFMRGLLDRGPADGAVLTVLGALALDDQRVNIANRLYEQARQFPDAEEAALLGLLKIHYLSGHWEEALSFADQLIAIDPGHAGAHAMRADALRGLGRPLEGIDAARTALEFNPTLIPVRQWLVETCRAADLTEEQMEQESIIQRMQEAHPPAR